MESISKLMELSGLHFCKNTNKNAPAMVRARSEHTTAGFYVWV
jgi:hypothetical protein